MRDVEFVSDVLLLTLSGTQSATRTVLDNAYESYSTEFEHMEAAVARFSVLGDFVATGYALGDEVKRMITKGWTYSLYDAMQRLVYGGPIEATGDRKPKRVADKTIRELCLRAQEKISGGNLPVAVEKATRGAASDKGSREVRAEFLMSLLDHP
jgi:hypothetical protein